MNKLKFPGILTVLFFIKTAAVAQCAMCRATIANSISTGHAGFAASLNTGIMYLFLMPYILAGIVAFLWFRTSKKNAGKKKIRIRIIR